MNDSMKCVLDKYSALETNMNKMTSSQGQRESDLQKQLLARRESLDSARQQLNQVEKSNMDLLLTVDEHVVSIS